MQVIDNTKIKHFNIDREDFNLTVTDLLLESDQEIEHPFEIEYYPVIESNTLVL